MAQTPGKTFSVETSTIGELLDNPAAKAVFAKYLPQVVANPMLDMGRDLHLPDIVQYEPAITPDKLAAIDADLKALPPQ
jgi:para-nitrobenzyl esterase